MPGNKFRPKRSNYGTPKVCRTLPILIPPPPPSTEPGEVVLESYNIDGRPYYPYAIGAGTLTLNVKTQIGATTWTWYPTGTHPVTGWWGFMGYIYATRTYWGSIWYYRNNLMYMALNRPHTPNPGNAPFDSGEFDWTIALPMYKKKGRYSAP